MDPREISVFETERRFICATFHDEISKVAQIAFVAYGAVLGLFLGAYLRYGVGSGVADNMVEKIMYVGSGFMLIGMFLVLPVLIWIVWHLKREVSRMEKRLVASKLPRS